MTNDASFYGQSESEEHYTPRYLWQRAEKVMGGIDCDPASDNDYNVSSARVHYTKRQDGLHQEWPGRVWLNPPFGRGVGAWFHKLATEIAEGRCTEACVLWKAAFETGEAKKMIRMPAYRCCAIPHRRVKYKAGEKKGSGGDSSTFTTAIYYFGPHKEEFIRIFSEVADIWIPVLVGKRDADLSRFTNGEIEIATMGDRAVVMRTGTP